MTKVIDETWVTQTGPFEQKDVVRSNGTIVAKAVSREAAMVAACAPEALRLLLAREWGRHNQCFECGGVSFVPAERSLYQGHKSSCAWVGLMRKAGIR